MTTFEIWYLIINGIGVIAAIFIILVAIWGEKFRQKWAKPRLVLKLADPTYNLTTLGINGWYYRLSISNSNSTSPAKNVRVLLTKVYSKGPDDHWRKKIFSGPAQVMWQWPKFSPLYATVGPDEYATFGCCLEKSRTFDLKLYWYPNNLLPHVKPNESTRLEFKAVSDTTESNTIIVEVAWDGKWHEGALEMQGHCIVKEVTD